MRDTEMNGVLWGRARAWRVLAAAIGLLLALAGCSGSAPPLQPTSSPATVQTAETASGESGFLEAARKAHADPSQIRILEKGEVGFADYESAVSRSLDCMRNAGIDVLGPDLSDSTGIKLLTYSWSPTVTGLSDEQATALGDDCLTRYSDFVDSAWQLQPSSVEAKERYFDRFRAPVVACIRKHGGTIKDHPSREEALMAAIPVQDSTGVDCFESSGIER